MDIVSGFPVERLYLIPPSDLRDAHQLGSTTVRLLYQNLQRFSEATTTGTQFQALAITKSALSDIELVEVERISEDDYLAQTSLKPVFVQEMDKYMKVCHIRSREPIIVVLMGFLTSYYSFLELYGNISSNSLEMERLEVGFENYASLLARVCSIDLASSSDFFSKNSKQQLDSLVSDGEKHLDANIEPLSIWRKGHWIFFIFIQALIICLRRLIRLADSGRLDEAKSEFNTATQLMWASGAAMKLASSYSKEIYDEFIRPTMMLAHPKALVHATDLSGMMSWDHHYLVNVVWKKEFSSFLKRMPVELQCEYEKFVYAYQEGLSKGHISICSRFGGKTTKSLFSSRTMAVDSLRHIEQSRLRQIGHLK